MNVVCAQITPAAASRATAPAPMPLSGRLAGSAPQRLAHAKAFSLYAGDATTGQTPFSFWPRPSEQGKAKAAPTKKAGKKAASAPEHTDEAQQLTLGKQRFRSALEQVSYYTNETAFNRE